MLSFVRQFALFLKQRLTKKELVALIDELHDGTDLRTKRDNERYDWGLRIGLRYIAGKPYAPRILREATERLGLQRQLKTEKYE